MIPPTREHPHLAGTRSVEATQAVLAGYDATLICTDHDGVDYDGLVRWSRLVVDTRNATRNVRQHADRVVKA